jgi:hypothetical protein
LPPITMSGSARHIPSPRFSRPAHAPDWRRRAGRRAAEEGGQALVEFALVATLLLLLVFGITQFGLALNSASDETQLASVAARYAAVNQNPAPGGESLQDWVKSQADTTILSSGGRVCISFPTNPVTGTSGQIGDPVQVLVGETMNWQPLYGISQLLGGGIPASSTISGTAVMRLEATPSLYSAGGTGCPA